MGKEAHNRDRRSLEIRDPISGEVLQIVLFDFNVVRVPRQVRPILIVIERLRLRVS